MKKSSLSHWLYVGLVLVSFGFTQLLAEQALAAKVVLKAISAWPQNDVAVVEDFLPFIKAANAQLEKSYPGQLEIRYLGGPEVIPTKDQAEGVRMGTVDLLFGTPAYYAGVAPAANVGKLSQLDSNQEKQAGADGVFDKIHREKLNAAYLGRLGSEIQFQLYTVKQIGSLADLKGFRIRTSPMYVDFIKALGAVPIEMAPSDVYQALERGVVDGYMWPLFSIRPWGWQEVTKYVVGPPFYKVVHPLIANAKKWDSVPDHLQKTILEALAKEAAASDARSLQQMKDEGPLLAKAGIKAIDFSATDEKAYLDLAYESGWEGQLKMEKNDTAQLRKLLSK